MIFTRELLDQLEQNTELKKTYAGQGSLGQNRWLALPVILGIFAAFGAYSFYDLSKTDPDYQSYTYICATMIATCLVAILVIQRNAKKMVMGNLEDVKFCLAKKIVGNDETEVSYCIYSVGDRRHDAEFIEAVTDKIYNLNAEPNEKLRTEVSKLFKINFEGMNATPVLLPKEFTFGEAVYKKEFKFATLDPQMKQLIKENNDQFIAISFNNRSVLPLRFLPDYA